METEIIPAAPAGFTDWLDEGRKLYQQRKSLDWACADWLATGQARFPEQMKLALIELVSDPIEQKRLAKSAKVAAVTPKALRDTSLTLDHYMHVADLPADEQLNLLSKASKEKLTARAFRVAVIERKASLDLQPDTFEDNDPEYAQIIAMARAWNRASKESRQEFYDMAGDAELGIVEA